MSLALAEKIIDFIFSYTPLDEIIEIGFFGGEPLLEFDLLKNITSLIEKHPAFNMERTALAVVTNGTIFSDEIGCYLKDHSITFCLSCDGPPFVHDMFRRFNNGRGSAKIVGENVKRAKRYFPYILVNAVYHPYTFRYLPQVIEYFSSLELNQIYISPDFSASWGKEEIELLPDIYNQIGNLYVEYYLLQRPHFISLIDSKISVILRGGYKPLERCRMGKGEFGFGPSGNIYPCERLIGKDDGKKHCIGSISEAALNLLTPSTYTSNGKQNEECETCGFKDYCMNWCGCSNYFSSGRYDRVSPFLCASEKAAIITAFNAFQIIEKKLGPIFVEHLSGVPPLSFYKGSKR
jgi:uncharacterized protein